MTENKNDVRISRKLRQNDIPKLVVPVMAAILIAVAVSVTVNVDISALSAGQWCVIVLSAALFMFSFSSLIGSVWTVGMLPSMCIAEFLYICTVRWEMIIHPVSRLSAVLHALMFGAAFLTAVAIIRISFLMLKASFNTAKDNDDITVVVLGCKIKNDKPSRMLAGRIKAAADYLKRNPHTVCVVSGGQGHDERYAEALVMRRYMERLGIDARRIIMEDRSVSTRENLAFSQKIILANGLPKKIAIATDRFHQYRASLIARNLGISSCAINRETKWYLVMQYWMREVAGIIELTIRGR